jgi:hypothetical protein
VQDDVRLYLVIGRNFALNHFHGQFFGANEIGRCHAKILVQANARQFWFGVMYLEPKVQSHLLESASV